MAIQETVADIKAQADEQVEKAKEQADQVTAQAKATVDDVTAQAKAKVDEVTANAKEQADVVSAQVQQAGNTLSVAANDAKDAVNASVAKLVEHEKVVFAGYSELLKARLEAAKAAEGVQAIVDEQKAAWPQVAEQVTNNTGETIALLAELKDQLVGVVQKATKQAEAA